MKSRPAAFPKTLGRYALAIDVICGAVLAIVAIELAAGIGVVGFGALVTLLVALGWMGIEAALARVRGRSATRPH